MIYINLGPPDREGALVLAFFICFPVLQIPLVSYPLEMRAFSWKTRAASSEPPCMPHDPHKPSTQVGRVSHPAPPVPVLYSLCLCSHTLFPPAREALTNVSWGSPNPSLAFKAQLPSSFLQKVYSNHFFNELRRKVSGQEGNFKITGSTYLTPHKRKLGHAKGKDLPKAEEGL